MSVDPATTTPDISTRIPLHAWTAYAERFGAQIPENDVPFAPNVAKPRSRGRVWFTSPSAGEGFTNPAVRPLVSRMHAGSPWPSRAMNPVGRT